MTQGPCFSLNLLASVLSKLVLLLSAAGEKKHFNIKEHVGVSIFKLSPIVNFKTHYILAAVEGNARQHFTSRSVSAKQAWLAYQIAVYHGGFLRLVAFVLIAVLSRFLCSIIRLQSLCVMNFWHCWLVANLSSSCHPAYCDYPFFSHINAGELHII